jgi:hypothetical protein
MKNINILGFSRGWRNLAKFAIEVGRNAGKEIP